MSGGAMNYAYTQIEYECVGKMGDRELDDLMADVAKLVHDREWNLSGDTSDETYAKSVRNFKEKWFESSRKDRMVAYINEAFNQTRTMCLNMIGIDGAMHSLTPMMVAQEKLVDKYGEFVDKTMAANILGVTRATIYAMITDGRLSVGYGGKRVSVRSISDYMQTRGA